MRYEYHIGVDPGKAGGIAVLNHDGDVIELISMPETPEDIRDFFRKYSSLSSVCIMEDVGYGLPGQSSKATATFARHNGHLDMAILCAEIPKHSPTPQKWMKGYSLGKSSSYTKTEWKNRLKAKAQQLFPKEKITLKTSDALLIAYYGYLLDNKGEI
jgi:hypothetical protein